MTDLLTKEKLDELERQANNGELCITQQLSIIAAARGLEALRPYAELARGGISVGAAQQATHMAKAACEALGLDYDETAPVDITEKVTKLQAAARELDGRRWIPVTERLPERAQTVSFWCRGWLPGATPGVGKFGTWEQGGLDVDVFTDETQMDRDDQGRVYYVADVIHWQAFSPPEPTNGR